jgi:uncharacterized protein (DUF885 family)
VVKARVVVAVVLATACAPVETPEAVRPAPEPSPVALREAASAFRTLRDGFLEWYYEANPVRASELGLRAHDARMTGVDRPSVQRRIDALLDWDGQLRRIPMRLMREDDRFDYAILEYGIRGELLDLEEVRWWAVDPVESLELIGRGLATLVDHRPAGAERTEALRARLSGSPAVLTAARSNLRSPPRTWTERAIALAAGLIEYVEALPARLAVEGDEEAARAVEPAAAELAAALRDHAAWLENDLLALSTGDFRLGRYLFTRKLLYDEHIDLPASELDRLNEEAIAELRERLVATAGEIDATRAPRAILDSLALVGSEGDVPVGAARQAMETARAWTLERGVVTVPAAPMPEAREAPAIAGAPPPGLSAPGPFDPPSTAAYFEVGATRDGDRGPISIRVAALHETYPGRFVQRLAEREVPSDLRRVFMPRALAAGWAHYAEALAIDEGFGTGDPAVRLVHLQRALQRHGRWYAAIHLHAIGRPVEQVASRVAEIAYLDDDRARRDVDRIARDPMALMDALGGIQIAELRGRYEAHRTGRDEEFVPRSFHDQLLRLGLPLPLATEALMPAPDTAARARRR